MGEWSDLVNQYTAGMGASAPVPASTPAPSKPTGFRKAVRTATDAAALFGSGAGDIPTAIGQGLQFAGAENLGQTFKDVGKTTTDYWENLKSEELKQTQAEPLTASNFIPKAAAGAVESLPGMVAMATPGGAAYKGLEAANVAGRIAVGARGLLGAERAAKAGNFITSGLAFGGAEGAYSGLSNAAQTEQEIISRGGTPEQARGAAKDVAWQTALATGGIGALTGGGMLGDVARGGARGIFRGAVKGAGEEAFQEGLQSPAETLIQNLAKRTHLDPKQALTEGVLESAILGAGSGGLLGAVGGGAAGVRSRLVEKINRDSEFTPEVQRAQDSITPTQETPLTLGDEAGGQDLPTSAVPTPEVQEGVTPTTPVDQGIRQDVAGGTEDDPQVQAGPFSMVRSKAVKGIGDLVRSITASKDALTNSEVLESHPEYDRTFPIPKQGGLIAATQTQQYQADPVYKQKVDTAIDAMHSTILAANRQKQFLEQAVGRTPAGESFMATYSANPAAMWANAAKRQYPDEEYLGNISVREALQNSLDAAVQAVRTKQVKNGTIDIRITGNGFTIADNGIGMDPDIIENKFLALGESGKDNDPFAQGGFGIAKAVILMPETDAKWKLFTQDNYFDSDMALRDDPIAKADRVQGTRLEVTSNNRITSARAQQYVALTEAPKGTSIKFNGETLPYPFQGVRGRKSTYSPRYGDTTVELTYYPQKASGFPEDYDGKLIIRMVNEKTGAKLAQSIRRVGGSKFHGTIVADVRTKVSPKDDYYPLVASRMDFQWWANDGINDIVQKYTIDSVDPGGEGVKVEKKVSEYPPWRSVLNKVDTDKQIGALMDKAAEIFKATGNYFGWSPRAFTPAADLIIEYVKGNRPVGKVQHVQLMLGYEAVARLYAGRLGFGVEELRIGTDAEVAASFGSAGTGSFNPYAVPQEFMNNPLALAMYLANTATHELTHYKHGYHDQAFAYARERNGDAVAELFPYVLEIAETITGKTAETLRTNQQVIVKTEKVPVYLDRPQAVGATPSQLTFEFTPSDEEVTDANAELYYPEELDGTGWLFDQGRDGSPAPQAGDGRSATDRGRPGEQDSQGPVQRGQAGVQPGAGVTEPYVSVTETTPTSYAKYSRGQSPDTQGETNASNQSKGMRSIPIETLSAAVSKDVGAPVSFVEVEKDSSDAEASLASWLEDALGVEVVYFQQASGPSLNINGAYIQGNTIYVNRNAKDPAAVVIAHEFIHSLEQQNPTLYRQFKKAIVAEIKDATGYTAKVNKARAQAGLSPLNFDAVSDEFLADFFSDRMGDSKFWNEVMGTNKGVMAKVLDKFVEFVDGLLARFTNKTDGYIKNLAKARSEAVRVLVEHAGTKSKEAKLKAEVKYATNRREEARGTSDGDALASALEQLNKDHGLQLTTRDVVVSATEPDKRLQALAGVFRKKVVLFTHATGAEDFQGLYVGGDRIFISDTATEPHLFLVGHELVHALRADNPDLYDAFVRAAEMYDASVRTAAQVWGETQEGAREEIIGDFFGEQMLKPAFWDSLVQSEPTLFQKLYTMLQELVAKLSGRSDVAASYFRDVKKAEQAAKQTLIAYARSNKISMTAAQAKLAAAWHGTPHDFDKFSTSKIGTGEGAQAYGYGLYFAGSREVAEWYREKLSQYDDTPLGQAWANVDHWQKTYDTRKMYADDFIAKKLSLPQSLSEGLVNSKEMLEKATSEALALGDRPEQNKGRLYHVELAPAEDEYLLWDKSIEDQSETVQNILEAAGYWDPDIDGRTLYTALVRQEKGDKQASEKLHSLGVRGIKYLDGTSRAGKNENYNYVIFNEDDVEIKNKYSLFSSPEKALNFFGKKTMLKLHDTIVKYLAPQDRWLQWQKSFEEFKPITKFFDPYINAQQELAAEQDGPSVEAVKNRDRLERAIGGKESLRDTFNNLMSYGRLWRVFPEGGAEGTTNWMKSPGGVTAEGLQVYFKPVKVQDGKTVWWAVDRATNEKMGGKAFYTKEEAAANVGVTKVFANEWAARGLDKKFGVSLEEAQAQVDGWYRQLPAPAKQVYHDMLKHMAAIYERKIDSLKRFVMDNSSSNEAEEELLKQIDAIDQMNRRENGPYAAFMRFGNYTLSVYEDADATTSIEYRHFDTEAQRDEFIEKNKERLAGKTVRTGLRGSVKDRAGEVPLAFEKAVEGLLVGNEKIDPALREELRDELFKMYVNTLPAQSDLQHSAKFTGKAGWEPDMARAYLGYVQNQARKIAHLNKGTEIRKLLEEMKSEAEAVRMDTGNNTRMMQLILDLEEAQRKAYTEEVPEFVQAVTKGTFLWMLTSPSMFLVQSTQPFMLTLPRLAARFGYTGALQAITKHYMNQTTDVWKRYRNEKAGAYAEDEARLRELDAIADEFLELKSGKVGEAAVRGRMRELTQGMDKLEQIDLAARIAERQGVLDIGLSKEAMEYVERGRVSKINSITKWGSLPMRVSEMLSRRAAFAAAFDMYFDRKSSDFLTAYEGAREVTNKTLFDYGSGNKALITRGPIGRIAMQFRTFQLHTMFHLTQLTHDAMKGFTPEDKSAARKELLFIAVNTAALGGLLAEAGLKPFLQALSFLLSDDDEEFDAELEFSQMMRGLLGETGGSVALKGLPALLGWDISRRVGMESIFDVINGNPPKGLKGDQLASWYASRLALGPTYSIAANAVKSLDAFKKGDWYGTLKNAPPRPIGDVVKGVQAMNEGYQTQAGKVLVKSEDVSFYDAALMMLGINPMEMSLASEKNAKITGMNENIKIRRSNLLRDIAEADDFDSRQEAMDAIRTYNQKMPKFAIRRSDMLRAIKAQKNKDLGLRSRRDRMIEDELYGEEE